MNNRGRHFLAISWLFAIIFLGIYSAQTLLIKGKIQFDLLALLPEGKTENLRLLNELMDDGNVSGRLVIIFGNENKEQAKKALLRFREQLKEVALPILEHSVKKIETDYKTLFTNLYPYRAGLLSKDDRQILLNAQDEVLVKSAMINIMSPFGSFNANLLSADPFGFYPRYVTSFLSDYSLQADAEGNLAVTADSKIWYVFQGEVTERIFSLELQEKISEKLLPILSQIEKETGAEVLRLGAAFYSSAGAQQAKNEISEIGLISIAGIILILLLIFRQTTPIFLALAVVSGGLISGLAACLFAFESVHILALVFGCSLVGVAVDYAIHYYCASFKTIDRFQIFSLLLPAMPLGVLTSSIGYGILIIAPFPGIQQMAVLACIGLLCTFISIGIWGPYFIKSGDRKTPPQAEKIQYYMGELARLGSIKNLKPVIGALLFFVFCTRALKITFDDNVRNFQAIDLQLKSQEEKIKAMMNFNNSTKFLAVSGRRFETILQSEEAITQELDKRGVGCRALSDLIPSQKRQQENAHSKLKFCEVHYPKIAKMLDTNQSFNQLEAGFSEKAMSADAQFIKNLPNGWKELLHVADDGLITGRVMINGTLDINEIENYPGMTYVDPIHEYSSLFASYRAVMMILVGTLLATFALIISIYQGIRASITVTLPVILSILTTVGIIGIIGCGFSMFHAMGLILVLCIGIDYALFLYWRKPDEKELLLLGNTLAAITTILSFGLLALSATTAVYSFGMTVFFGIVLNFFITTLFIGNTTCKKS